MSNTTKMDAALEHARNGFRVFPLVPNGKRPLIEGWRTAATTDKSRVRQWWIETPDANIGIATDDFIVIDVDPRKGGDISFQQLALVEDLPKTRRSDTWSGGAHILYRLPPGAKAKGGANVLGPGLDIRSWGGLIAAPGSMIDGKPYRWGNDRPPAEAPQWLIDACKRPADKTEMAGKRVVEEDATAIARAQQWLETHAPEAMEGERDDTAFKVAARLYDEGVRSQTCRELLTDWSFTHCFPPMDEADISRLVASAARNRTKAIGANHPQATGFTDESANIRRRGTHPSPDVLAAPTSKFTSVPAGEAAKRALTHTAKPLIKGFLTRGGLSIVYGPPNSGKSFIALDLSRHIGAGEPWAEKRTHRGAVLYVAAEGGASIYARLAALETRYGQLEACALHILPHSVDLLHGTGDADAVVAEARRLETASGVKVELVVVDTVARAMSGGDENSSQDMGVFVKHLDRVRAGASCHVMGIHHTGKDRAKGARGHSSLLGAVDTEIEVDGRRMRVTKQRDMERAADIGFKLKPVRIGVDEEGDEVTSCFVELFVGKAAPVGDMTPEQTEWLEALVQGSESDKKPVFGWEDAQKWFGPKLLKNHKMSDATSQASQPLVRTSVRKRLDTLCEIGGVIKIGENQWVTPQNSVTPA